MSGIPPAGLGSIIQTQGAQAQAAERKAREDGAQTERTGPAAFAGQLQDVIEAADRDSQVYADAEGTGSQGRPFEAARAAENPGELPVDEKPSEHLDIQA